jgi:phosphohistidine phosphatase SixA
VLCHSKPQEEDSVPSKKSASVTSLLKSKLKLLLVDHLPTLKDYLMNLKSKSEMNKLATPLCLPETKLLVLLKMNSELVKSLKEMPLLKEPLFILPLVNLHSKKHSSILITPNKISLIPKPL